MKHWPLRWKIAHYSAGLAVTATLAGATTTWFIMRHAEIAAFDRRLTIDAEEFFRDVEHFEGGRTNSRPAFKEILVPLSLRKHLVEVTDASGAVLYLSPRLRRLRKSARRPTGLPRSGSTSVCRSRRLTTRSQD